MSEQAIAEERQQCSNNKLPQKQSNRLLLASEAGDAKTKYVRVRCHESREDSKSLRCQPIAELGWQNERSTVNNR